MNTVQPQLRYWAVLTPDELGGYCVTFPDVPEAITQGDSLEDALMMGADALETAFEFYVEDGRPFPLPSSPKDVDGRAISASADVLSLDEDYNLAAIAMSEDWTRAVWMHNETCKGGDA